MKTPRVSEPHVVGDVALIPGRFAHFVAGPLRELLRRDVDAGANPRPEVVAAVRALRDAADTWASTGTCESESTQVIQTKTRTPLEHEDNWISRDEAADTLGVTPQRISQLLTEDGPLVGEKVRGRWQIDPGSIRAHLEDTQPP